MTFPLALLPALAVAGTFGVIVLRRHDIGRREALLEAAALAAVWLVSGTELLGWAGVLGRGALAAWWAVPAATTLAYLVRARHGWPPLRPFPRAERPWHWIVIAPLLALSLLSLLAAAFAPPNNYDSLTYHLPRVIFWLQQQTVEHFSTNNLRQLMMPPLSEYANAHLLALGGSDRILGLTQWCAVMVTLAATTLVARRLGGDGVVQWLACLVVLSSPLVFMQASSTKNDLVVGMWVAIATWWALRAWDEAPTLRASALFGVALGAAALTKGTGVLLVAPAAVVAVVAAFRWLGAGRALGRMGIALAVALALNGPFLARNVRAFGAPLGRVATTEGGYDLANRHYDLRSLASNASRTLAQEASLPGSRWNAWLTGTVTAFHETVLGISVNDPTTTTPYSRFVRVRYASMSEDVAGSPVHVLLLLALPFALLARRPETDLRRLLLILGMAGAAFALLCLVLKWQEWNVRFVASLAGAFAPGLAVSLGAIRRGRAGVIVLTTAALCVAVLPTARRNPRPVFSRGSVLRRDVSDLRFAHKKLDPTEFAAIAGLVSARHAIVIGLATGGDDPDYLLLKATADAVPWDLTFEYVNPRHVVPGTRHLEADLVIASATVAGLTDRETGTRYRLERAFRRFSALVPDRPDPAPGVAAPAAL